MTEIEEELRFHFDQLVEKLCAEGLTRESAEREALRRFGDVGELTEECVAAGAGPIGRCLQWCATSPAVAFVVLGLCLLAMSQITGPPAVQALLFALLPVALAAATCSLLGAGVSVSDTVFLRLGDRLLKLLALLSVALYFFSDGDLVHSLWSVQYPLCGLLLGAGPWLYRVWRSDDALGPYANRGVNGAMVAAGAALVLGGLPLLLGLQEVKRLETSIPGALLEVAMYGFGGDLPAFMEPYPGAAHEVRRGMGSPPRAITVTMGSTLFASAYWIQFVLLAMVGRFFIPARKRPQFLLVAPLVLSCASYALFAGHSYLDGLWDNEPWLVRAYGPILLLAFLCSVGLLLAVRVHRKGLDGKL